MNQLPGLLDQVMGWWKHIDFCIGINSSITITLD